MCMSLMFYVLVISDSNMAGQMSAASQASQLPPAATSPQQKTKQKVSLACLITCVFLPGLLVSYSDKTHIDYNLPYL